MKQQLEIQALKQSSLPFQPHKYKVYQALKEELHQQNKAFFKNTTLMFIKRLLCPDF